MLKAGIEIANNCNDDHLIIKDRIATGAVLESGKSLHADIVVSNVDPNFLLRHMVPEKSNAPPKIKRRVTELSMGLFVLFFGVLESF